MATKAIKLSDGTNTLLPITNAKLVQVNSNECLENRLVGIIDLVSFNKTYANYKYVCTLTCTGNFNSIVDGQIFLIRFNNVSVSSWNFTSSSYTNTFVITLSNNTTITKNFVATSTQIFNTSEWYNAKYAFIIYNGTNDRFEPVSMNYYDADSGDVSKGYMEYNQGPTRYSFVGTKSSQNYDKYMNTDNYEILGYIHYNYDDGKHEDYGSYIYIKNLITNNVDITPFDATGWFVTPFNTNNDDTYELTTANYNKLINMINSGCANMIYIRQSDTATKTWCYGCQYNNSKGKYYLYFINCDEFLKFIISSDKKVQRVSGSYKVTKNFLVDNSKYENSIEGQEYSLHFNYSKYNGASSSEGFASPVGFNNKVRFVPYSYSISFYENDETTNAFTISRDNGIITGQNSNLMSSSESISDKTNRTAYMWDPNGGITYIKVTNTVEQNNVDIISSNGIYNIMSENELVISTALNDLNARIMTLESENLELMNRVAQLEAAMEAYAIDYTS